MLAPQYPHAKSKHKSVSSITAEKIKSCLQQVYIIVTKENSQFVLDFFLPRSL